MPHKPIDKDVLTPPEWMETLASSDLCLYEMLIEALVARDAAMRAGATHRRRTKAALKAGDDTIDQIAFGRYGGSAACRKAATALRKYTQALEGATVRK